MIHIMFFEILAIQEPGLGLPDEASPKDGREVGLEYAGKTQHAIHFHPLPSDEFQHSRHHAIRFSTGNAIGTHGFLVEVLPKLARGLRGLLCRDNNAAL